MVIEVQAPSAAQQKVVRTRPGIEAADIDRLVGCQMVPSRVNLLLEFSLAGLADDDNAARRITGASDLFRHERLLFPSPGIRPSANA
jgi:hypothetical protein